MTSSSAAVSPGSRLAGTRPIAAEITPGEWLLHRMRDGSDEANGEGSEVAGRNSLLESIGTLAIKLVI
ncbi:hypothetical protein EYF80_051377 [Liparis tanakae]|uniref:Uncharacterized protein n=1 Tax=Liparis tanakae TaxID=230148 RepID=A0A4Z2FDJ1_9TELE|nr:hypothetical protein EYF80_051377 [Liparis tanakae]